MTDGDEIVNRQPFRSDPADIRVRINPETRIRIPDQFLIVDILALAEFALAE